MLPPSPVPFTPRMILFAAPKFYDGESLRAMFFAEYGCANASLGGRGYNKREKHKCPLMNLYESWCYCRGIRPHQFLI